MNTDAIEKAKEALHDSGMLFKKIREFHCEHLDADIHDQYEINKKAYKALAALDEDAVPVTWCFTDVNGKPIELTGDPKDIADGIIPPSEVSGRFASEMFWRGVYAMREAMIEASENSPELSQSESNRK